MVSRSVVFGPTDPTADTEGTIGSAYTFAGTGRIKSIRYSGYQGTADKAASCVLYLFFKKLAGPFEFAVTSHGGVVEGGGQGKTDEIDTDIPYDNGEQVTVKLKAAETTTDVTISLTCVE